MKMIFNHFILSSIFILIFSFTSCYQLFQTKTPMSDEKTGTSLADLLSKEESSEIVLPAPEQIFVSQGLYSDCIKISWTSVKGAASYRLERAIKKADDKSPVEDSDYVIIQASDSNINSSSFISGTDYSDHVIQIPTYESEEYSNIYYYRVRAENDQTGATASDYIVSEQAYLFAPPMNIYATAGESTENITVTWNQVQKAVQYNIYRSADSNNSNPVFIGSVSGDVLSYVNTINTKEQGLDFFYTVEAVNSNRNSSVISATAMGFALKEGAPARVTNVKITAGKGRGDGNAAKGIEITWTPVPSSKQIYYTVFRSSSKDSSLTQIATGIKTTSIIDKKSLKANTYYYYRVLAYTEENSGETAEIIKGPMSNSSEKDSDPAEGFILSAPEDISVDKQSSYTQIKFSQPIGEKGYLNDSECYTENYKTFSYNIYGGNSTDSISATVSFDEVYPIDGYYTVVTNDSYKFYQIETVNVENGSISALSQIVAPSPTAVTNVSASRAAFIPGVTTDSSAANANGIYPVKISWSAPYDGADGGYHVYRSTKADSGFRCITETPVTELYYIDSNDSAKAGTFYYYKVLSLNTLKQGNNYSNAVEGYGALTHDQYMREYNKTIQSSQKRLTYMHKTPDTAKLGTETVYGENGGSLYYDAGMSGAVTMRYEHYADYFLPGTNKPYFLITGNTNTAIEGNLLAKNGHMNGTVECSNEGMYPGTVKYDHVEIVSGSAGGGYYLITPAGFPEAQVSYKVGNEGW